jgi:hypothetical protein
MVEINIEIEPNAPTKLQELLEHVIKEITDAEYRADEQTTRGRSSEIDNGWVHTKQGKYNWRRND